MSQFGVIADVQETLKELLRDSFTRAGFTTVTVNTDVPKKDNIKNKPAVNCYLYHIGFAPNYKERTQSLVTTHDRDGNIVEFYQDAPVYLYAHFILSIWGGNSENRSREENLLMGLVVKTFLENPVLEKEKLKGEAFYPGDAINIYPNLQSDYNDILSFWRSIGEEVRPAVCYYVKFRIESERRSADVKRVTGKDFAYR
jgi:hypothetical protein